MLEHKDNAQFMLESQLPESIHNGELDGKIQAFCYYSQMYRCPGGRGTIRRFRWGLFSNTTLLCMADTQYLIGVPTFRGKDGVWRKHDALSLSTPAAFIGNPSRIWQFHHFLRETCVTSMLGLGCI